MKTVLILGAGCSAGLAGLPTDAEFMEELLAPYYRSVSLSNPSPQVPDDLFFVDLVYKLFYNQGVKSFYDLLTHVRLEVFWNEIDENFNRPKVVLHSNTIDGFLKKAKELSLTEKSEWRYFEKYVSDNTEPFSPYEYLFMFAGWQLRRKVVERYSLIAKQDVLEKYGKLIEKVKSKSSGLPTVISFNYDTLLEQALSGAYHYVGLHGCEFQSGVTNIIKPHGSVNWRHIANESITAVEKPIPLNEVGYNSQGQFQQHSVVGLVAKKIEFASGKQIDTVVSSLYANRLLPLVTNAIRDAEQIIVIGYSFPMTDTHVVQSFKNAKPKNLNNGIYVTKFKNSGEVDDYGVNLFRWVGAKSMTWTTRNDGVEKWLGVC